MEKLETGRNTEGYKNFIVKDSEGWILYEFSANGYLEVDDSDSKYAGRKAIVETELFDKLWYQHCNGQSDQFVIDWIKKIAKMTFEQK